MERRLGKGLAEILETSGQTGTNMIALRTEQIRPGRYQPREKIDEQPLEELKASIKQHGIIQPVVVRPVAHGIYELVAGERRWRAAQALGLKEVPAIVRALTDQQTVELSLIENLHRENLNAIEEAQTYQRLLDEFHYTHEQLSEIIGKDRATISNSLRLLRLPQEAQKALKEGKISPGHAKVLLGVEPVLRQVEILKEAVANELSVRALEALIAQGQPAKPRRRRAGLEPHMKSIEDTLRNMLGTKVSVIVKKRGGRIVIDYFSNEDLSRLLQLLGAGDARG